MIFHILFYKTKILIFSSLFKIKQYKKKVVILIKNIRKIIRIIYKENNCHKMRLPGFEPGL